MSFLQSDESILGKKSTQILELCSDPSQIDQLPSPRLIITHIALEFLPQEALNSSKVIYIVRNPKSTSVSYYHMQCNMNGYDYSGDFKGFQKIHDSIGGQFNMYGSWFEHVITYWKKFQDKPNSCFVCYEELKKNPVEGIQKISSFLGLNRDVEFCRAIAEKTSFESMLKIQKEQNHEVNALWKGGQSRMLRKGTADDWKNFFTVKQSEEFDEVYQQRLKDCPELLNIIKFE